MTQPEIVALRCPSCGGGITQPSREMAFGAEFRCGHCNITSVLIIDQALIPLSSLQKQGERVCIACGRVAQREARFCQEGHALVRKCIKCLTEFAVDHQRCDSCGWPQSVKLGTDEGNALAFDRAISDLADPSYSVVDDALRVISAGGGNASRTAITAAVSEIHSLMMDPSFRRRRFSDSIEEGCWQALSNLGPAAVSTILSVMMNTSFCQSGNSDDPNGSPTDVWSLRALGNLGSAAQQAVPMLRQRLEELWPFDKPSLWYPLLECLGAISPEDALAFCSRSLEAEGAHTDSKRNDTFVRFAFSLGKVAIPTLEKFCGPFSGRRGKLCKAAVSALHSGQTTLSLPL